MNLDLNCDLGEGEPRQRTRSLMRSITSANIACGGHAGDLNSMTACVRLCNELGVNVGAHPGAWSRSDFGRGPVQIKPTEFEMLLVQQVSALERITKEQRVRLHHIKLHGTLYHETEAIESLARSYIDTVKRFWPKVIIFARADGRIARIARRSGVLVWEEAFVDRAYRDNGELVPRAEPGAVLADMAAILRRVVDLKNGRGLLSCSRCHLSLRPRTLCIHSDTRSAAVIARKTRTLLRALDK